MIKVDGDSDIKKLVLEFVERIVLIAQGEIITRVIDALADSLKQSMFVARLGSGTSVPRALRKESKVHKPRAKQICPVPRCKGLAAPIFGMVCSQHKDVPKSSIQKYREQRRAKKLGLKVMPKKTAPKKTSPKKTSPKKAAPKKTAPKKVATKKAAPKKAESKKAAPKKATPKKTIPKKAAPKKAAPKRVAGPKAETPLAGSPFLADKALASPVRYQEKVGSSLKKNT